MCLSACELPFWQRIHGPGDQDCCGLSSYFESIGTFPFFLFSRILDRVSPNKSTKLGCINYHICLNSKKNDFTRSDKKKYSFYRQIVLSFRRDFAPVTRPFFGPSLYILYAADFNYLIRWIIVTYILVDIIVVNSHAISAYKCELLAVTWHDIPSVRLDNADQWFGRENGAYSLPTPCRLFTISVAFLRVSISNCRESWFGDCSIGLAWGSEKDIWAVNAFAGAGSCLGA